MRGGIESFLTAYAKPAPPAEIRQQPLDGNPGHYARLTALDDGALPTPRDFGDYASDICTMEEVQPALFASLLPAYIEDALSRAAERLEGVLDSPVPARMLAEFASQRPLLKHRLQVLPDILAQPLNATLTWPPMG